VTLLVTVSKVTYQGHMNILRNLLEAQGQNYNALGISVEVLQVNCV